MKRKFRVGQFKIPKDMWLDAWPHGDGANIFIGMFVLNADQDWWAATVTYRGIHQDFDLIDEGSIPPEYIAIFAAGAIAPRWVRVDNTKGQTNGY